MKYFAVLLVLLVILEPTLTIGLYKNWKNFLPWAKDMPESEYKNYIYLNLVKKDWKPKVARMPNVDHVIPKYPGTVLEAYDALVDPANLYKFETKPLTNGLELLKGPYGYDKNLDSIFITHTISGDSKNWMVRNLMIALAMRNFIKNYNVFAINMPGLQSSIEKTAVKSFFGLKTNYYGLGKTIGEFFHLAIQEKLIQPNQINLVGFCWSAQLSGYIARRIRKENNQKIKSIVALDPHSLGLSRLYHKVLTAEDAEMVQAYHTNSITFGTLRRRATVDLVFNSGIWQPGCYKSKNRMCSHRRAVTVLWYVIIYPDLFVARECSNWLLFKTCLCNKRETADLTFPPRPGGVHGKFYINTMSHKPYGYGAEGANCYVKHKDKNAVIIKDKNHLFKRKKESKDNKKNNEDAVFADD